ncbi:hypothetical protein AJ79_06266 [Helicocarpus griseus UAMH5409]|uniref:Uncharacterized protein n=1 Tax=Helicocarpus griseus UAMH5409 TaxID=1447875 RepID=A0A2B7XFH6_9EURO|nr:hypothetical protein AJ79_06266 [Helicocarpus griseus UAMH5409]
MFAAILLVSSFMTGTLAQGQAKQIRGVSDPIYHLYLQADAADPTIAILGPEASADSFFITETIQSSTTGMYLNIEPNDSASYKKLVFGAEGTTTAWGLEGDTIITTTGSEYGRQLNYVACEAADGAFTLYLQTGSDLPEGACTNYLTIHLPCLC